ncbi:hypothetical protein NW752_011652 [Fusarium irregulare]|nr:hypothetical protein NW752_011652 [Fusarium irregulare]
MVPEVDERPDNKGPTIAAAANECLQSFQKCFSSASLVGPRELSMIEDQAAKFSSWANAIAVFAPGSSSMDHRLRYAPEVHSVVTGLLESLTYQCEKCWDSLTAILQPLNTSGENLSADWLSKSLTGIAAEISRLNKISNTIRRASKDAQSLTASKFFIKDDEGNNVESTLLSNFQRHINDRFPGVVETIQERLARTMVLRRRQILYRRYRQGSAYAKRQDTIPALPLAVPTAKTFVSIGKSKSIQSKANSSISKAPTATPSQIKSATTLAPEKFKIAAATPSVISTSKTIALQNHESLAFPPAPGQAIKRRYDQLKRQRQAAFEQGSSTRDGEGGTSATSQELLDNDLQGFDEITCPYCLCTLPIEEVFDERKWHEDYMTHMREIHVTKLSEKQLRMVANKNGRSAKLFPVCPLCGKGDVDIDGRVEDHVAGHLRSLALKSLPSYHEDIPDEDEGINDSIDASRPNSRSTVRDLREDADYVPYSLFTSQEFWDTWTPPMIEAPWLNFLNEAYECVDLPVNHTSLALDTHLFQKWREDPEETNSDNDEAETSVARKKEKRKKTNKKRQVNRDDKSRDDAAGSIIYVMPDQGAVEHEHRRPHRYVVSRTPSDHFQQYTTQAFDGEDMDSTVETSAMMARQLTSVSDWAPGSQTTAIHERKSPIHDFPSDDPARTSGGVQIEPDLPSIPELSSAQHNIEGSESSDRPRHRTGRNRTRGIPAGAGRTSGVFIDATNNEGSAGRERVVVGSPPTLTVPNNTPDDHHHAYPQVQVQTSRTPYQYTEEAPHGGRQSVVIIDGPRPGSSPVSDGVKNSNRPQREGLDDEEARQVARLRERLNPSRRARRGMQWREDLASYRYE